MMNRLLIRRMESADIPNVQAIAQEYLGEEAWSQAGFQADVDNPLAIPLAAFRNAELVGFLCAQVVCDEGTLLLLAIRADCRKQGIAAALLAAMRDMGQTASSFALEVRASNLPAISFYEKQGFLLMGRRKNFYSHPAEDALIYVLNTGKEG